jgi:4-amino-4-deoxy-L-arabinose transferase-like glycosyltransferase
MKSVDQIPVATAPVVALSNPPAQRFERALGAAVLVLYFLLILVCQRVSHAGANGFGSYPDESSHYVTGLMVHDYLRTGMGESPVAFARQFYLHFPLIGIGHWPPLFYAVEGLWMLAAGTSRSSDLVLIAIIAALLAFELYRLSRAYAGRWGAFFVGLWLLAVPVMRWSDDLIMLDVFAALLILHATVRFGRFMETERAQDSIWFGVAAGLAFLAKPAALCLVFVPAMAILMTGRYRLLRKPALWYAVPIVAVLVAPWYYYTLPLAFYGHNTLSFRQGLAENFPLFFRQLWDETSFLGVLGLIGIGIWVARAGKRLSGVEASLAVLPAAVLISILVAHVDLEPRYIIPAIAPLLVAACVGLLTLVRMQKRAGASLGALLLATAAFAGISRMPGLLDNAPGVGPLATVALRAAPAAGTTMLVVAPTASREGRIMAELAMRSRDRNLNVVVRATKLLADVDWNATRYKAYAKSPDEMLQILDRSGIDLLLIDVTGKIPSVWSHYDFAMELPSLDPSRFQEIGQFPGGGAPIYKLYRVLPGLHPTPRTDLMLRKLNEKFGAGSR